MRVAGHYTAQAAFVLFLLNIVSSQRKYTNRLSMGRIRRLRVHSRDIRDIEVENGRNRNMRRKIGSGCNENRNELKGSRIKEN